MNDIGILIAAVVCGVLVIPSAAALWTVWDMAKRKERVDG